jgi:hypothetical protein
MLLFLRQMSLHRIVIASLVVKLLSCHGKSPAIQIWEWYGEAKSSKSMIICKRSSHDNHNEKGT